MSKQSNGAGTGMDGKVQIRQLLIGRAYNYMLRLLAGKKVDEAGRTLLADMACFIRNPPKMRPARRVEVDHFAIWKAATDIFGEDKEIRGQRIRDAIESGASVSVPLADLGRMRDRITELQDRLLDAESFQ